MRSNTARGYSDYAGQPAPTQYDGFLPGFENGSYSGLSQAVWTVEGNSQYLVYAGEFVAVNGTAQQGIVRFSMSGGNAGAQPGNNGDNNGDNNGNDNGDNNDGKDKKNKKNKDKKDKKNKKNQDGWDNQDDWDNQDGWDQNAGDNNQGGGWWWW